MLKGGERGRERGIKERERGKKSDIMKKATMQTHNYIKRRSMGGCVHGLFMPSSPSLEILMMVFPIYLVVH